MEHNPYEVTVAVTVKYWLDDNKATVMSGSTIDEILRAIANDILDGWITRNEIEMLSLLPIKEDPWHDPDHDRDYALLERAVDIHTERVFGRGGGEIRNGN